MTTVRKLDSEIERLKKRREVLVETGKDKVRTAVEKLLLDSNYTLSDLYGPKPWRKPKYVNPTNPRETWTGKGRRPNWMARALERGAKVDDFMRA